MDTLHSTCCTSSKNQSFVIIHELPSIILNFYTTVRRYKTNAVFFLLGYIVCYSSDNKGVKDLEREGKKLQ